jgi:hypothetical protein
MLVLKETKTHFTEMQLEKSSRGRITKKYDAPQGFNHIYSLA